MAANPKKGNYGKLVRPKQRAAQLRKYAYLSLRAAGAHLGLGPERMRQLYRLYGIRRKNHVRTPPYYGDGWYHLACGTETKLVRLKLIAEDARARNRDHALKRLATRWVWADQDACAACATRVNS